MKTKLAKFTEGFLLSAISSKITQAKERKGKIERPRRKKPFFFFEEKKAMVTLLLDYFEKKMFGGRGLFAIWR